MKISTHGRYGLRLLIELVLIDSSEYIPLSDLAKRTDISLNYLESIIKPLKIAGMLDSSGGSTGGYKMLRSPSNLSVYEVLSVLEGNFLQNSMESTDAMPYRDFLNQTVWNTLDDAVVDYLKSVSIQTLVDQAIVLTGSHK